MKYGKFRYDAVMIKVQSDFKYRISFLATVGEICDRQAIRTFLKYINLYFMDIECFYGIFNMVDIENIEEKLPNIVSCILVHLVFQIMTVLVTNYVLLWQHSHMELTQKCYL